MAFFGNLFGSGKTFSDRMRYVGDFKTEEYRDARMYAKPLAAMRPTLPRTQETYARVLNAFAAAAEEFLR